jgi:2-methylcitrate dehydratase PrpD
MARIPRGETGVAEPGVDVRYRSAFLDWLACAVGGREQTGTVAARHAGSDISDRIVALGASGHVLDFDDTYLPGLVHLSAPTAPAALVLGADLGATVGDVLESYAAGFEAMAALARASHPALYERGWHPTAVCGVVGAAIAAARLLGLDLARTGQAVRLALLGAGGLRAAFGSDGKSLQVGMAAATGERAARLARSGASVPDTLPTAAAGFEDAYGGRWAEADPDEQPAARQNWIKAYPCCLQAHSAIEAAAQSRGQLPPPERATVTVHPVSRQAAAYDDVETALQAKFSIPYLTAFTLLHGPPTVGDFNGVDAEARRLSSAVLVRTDPALLESEAVLEMEGGVRFRVEAARGSPARPMDAASLAEKVRSLAGSALDDVLADPSRPAASLLQAVLP